MRRLWGWLRQEVERRRTRRDFVRLRAELEALNRRVGEQPWWSELPQEEKPRRR